MTHGYVGASSNYLYLNPFDTIYSFILDDVKLTELSNSSLFE